MAISVTPDPCAIGRVLAIIGGKWKGPIIYWLRDEPRRFNELRRLIPEISSRVLTVQLRQLEDDGIVCHSAVASFEQRQAYTLTPLGEKLIPLLDEIKFWSRSNLVDDH